MVGNAKQADALTTTTAPFTDVSAQRWSAGYIAYCVQAGIIDGMGDGTFDPTGKVTGLQFAKMLLCAVGYGVNDEYVGDNWAINTAKDALNLGIFNGNLAGSNNTPATREECALYAFNVLELEKVSYSALLGDYITSAWGSSEANKSNTIAGDYGLNSTRADDDAFERMGGHYWYVNKQSNRISNYYDDDKYLVASYTTPVKGNELYAVLGASFVKATKNAQFEVYVDGVENEDIKLSDIAKDNDKTLGNTGYGVQTYVYAWTTENEKGADVNHVRIVVINTFLAQVNKVDAKAGTVTLTIDDDVKIGDVTYSIKNTYETESFDKGDYVLVTASGKDGAQDDDDVIYEIQSMTDATLKTAEITKYAYTAKDGTHKITADGITYTNATVDFVPGDEVAAHSLKNSYVDGNEYTLIIDEYGYLIGIVEPDVNTTYVYVAQLAIVDETDGLKKTTKVKADVYYADGTNEVVTINIPEESDDYLNKVAGAIVGQHSAVTEWETAVNDPDGNDCQLGLYILEPAQKGTYDLSKPDNTNTGDAGFKVIKGIARLYNAKTENTAGKWIATSDTVYFYVTGTYGESDFNVAVYTGYKNAPTTGANQKIAKGNIAADDDNYVEAAVITGKPDVTYLTTDLYYWDGSYDKGANERTVIYKVTDIYGEEHELTYTYESARAATEAISSNQDVLDSFFKAKENGFFEEYTTDVIETSIVNVYDSTTIVVNSGKAYSIEDATLFSAPKKTDAYAGKSVKMIVAEDSWNVIALIFT